MLLTLIAGLAAPAVAPPSPPVIVKSTIGRCLIRGDNGTWTGPCRITRADSATTMQSANDQPLAIDWLAVTINEANSQTVVHFTGTDMKPLLTRKAQRSTTDQHCWQGKGFFVCAY